MPEPRVIVVAMNPVAGGDEPSIIEHVRAGDIDKLAAAFLVNGEDTIQRALVNPELLTGDRSPTGKLNFHFEADASHSFSMKTGDAAEYTGLLNHLQNAGMFPVPPHQFKTIGILNRGIHW